MRIERVNVCEVLLTRPGTYKVYYYEATGIPFCWLAFESEFDS